MTRTSTAFASVPQGFGFPNYFELQLPSFHLPLAGEVDLNKVVFGLCGGMCFSALDYYYAKTLPPAGSDPGKIDKALYHYLVDRQLDSMSIPILLKIIDWMVSGDTELAARVIKTEAPKIRRMIDKGDPAVLCLIRTHGLDDPTHNHQVLATAYELDDTGRQLTLTLYDPNHPGQAPTITFTLDRAAYSAQQSTGETLRGVFVIPYKPQANLSLPVIAAPAAVSFAMTAEADSAPAPAPAAPEPPFRLRWPVDSRVINQRFGDNPALYRPFNLAGHEGIDFFAPEGAKIYAAFDGVVSEAKYRGAYGNQVRIRHQSNGAGFTTVYAHMEKILATAGQQVQAGDLIGLADNTGNSHGSHMHLTLFIDGAKTPGYYDGIVDPWPYLEGNAPPPPPTLSGICVYTTQTANLRALPSTDADLVTKLPGGEILPVFGDPTAVHAHIGQQNQWLQVKTGGGQSGYLAAWLAADVAGQTFPPSGLVVYPFDTLAVRSGPGLGLAQVGTVASTDPLNVLGSADAARSRLGQKDQWLQVQTQAGVRGFVPAWLVRVTGDMPPAVGLNVYPTGDVNVRANPTTASDIIAVVAVGDTLKVLGDRAQAQAKVGLQNQWLNVQAPNGVIGWIAAWFVTATPPVHAQPPAGGPPPGQPPPGQPPVAPTAAFTVYPVPPDGVNLRASQDAASMRMGGAAHGQALTVLDSDLSAARARVGQQDQWIYVDNNAGVRGWVAAWYVSATPG